jgi:hypothetical protein
VFGCSFTFGYGLPVSGLWHTLLGQTLNQSVANFGINGLSATSAIDVFLIASNHIKIKKAIFLLPQFERYQITKTDVSTGEINYLNIIPNHNSRLCNCYGVDSEQIYKAVPEEQMFRDVRNSLYIAEHIANQRNIDVYVSTWSNKSYKLLEQMNFSHMKLLPEWRHPTEIGIDVARDGKHPGFKLNQYFANLITPHI